MFKLQIKLKMFFLIGPYLQRHKNSHKYEFKMERRVPFDLI